MPGESADSIMADRAARAAEKRSETAEDRIKEFVRALENDNVDLAIQKDPDGAQATNYRAHNEAELAKELADAGRAQALAKAK